MPRLGITIRHGSSGSTISNGVDTASIHLMSRPEVRDLSTWVSGEMGLTDTPSKSRRRRRPHNKGTPQ